MGVEGKGEEWRGGEGRGGSGGEGKGMGGKRWSFFSLWISSTLNKLVSVPQNALSSFLSLSVLLIYVTSTCSAPFSPVLVNGRGTPLLITHSLALTTPTSLPLARKLEKAMETQRRCPFYPGRSVAHESNSRRY